MNMTQSVRLASRVVAVGCACAFTLPQPRAAAGGTECAPLITFHAGVTTCYRPRHLSLAEQRLPVHPLTPVAPVTHIVHLALRQVLVLNGCPSGGPGPVFAIVYVFGTPAPACRTFRYCGPYVIVEEIVGRLPAPGHMVTYQPGIVPGPWHLRANMPGRRLILHLISNSSERAVRGLGQELLAPASALARSPLS